MSISHQEALRNLDAATKAIFAADRRIHSVGITCGARGYEYRAVRNAARVVAQDTAPPVPQQIAQIPVSYTDALHDAHALVRLPSSGPGSPGTASLVSEQGRFRPLVCGLQIQNFDYDNRKGDFATPYITVG